jgi:hypothetical protein
MAQDSRGLGGKCRASRCSRLDSPRDGCTFAPSVAGDGIIKRLADRALIGSGSTTGPRSCHGIIDWDLFHVRVAFEVNELEGKVTKRGFHN